MNTNKIERIKAFARALQSRVIAVALMLVIFATTVFAAFSTSYSVNIIDNGVDTQVLTTRTEPIEILNQVDKQLNSMDKIDISDFEAGKGGKIIIDRAKTIHIEYCNQIKSVKVYSVTVGDAIKEAGYSLAQGDKVNYKLSEKVTDGMIVTIAVLKPIQIVVDGKTILAGANNVTVADVISANDITLNEKDIVTPELTAPITEGMVITINRVTVSEVTVNEPIPFGSSTVNSADLDKGAVQIKTSGVNGEKAVVYSVVAVDGVEQSRTAVSETVVNAPVNQVKVVGTRVSSQLAPAATPASNSARSWNGISEGSTFGGNVSHYCACGVCGSGRGVTASGVKVWNGMDDPYIVACNWLPLGTVIRVNGVTYTVNDRGGKTLSSKGRLDVFTPAGHAACKQLGRKNVTIEIIHLAKTN